MTVDELIAEAAKLGGWRVCKRGLIRHGRACPLVAVAKARGLGTFRLGSWSVAGQVLGMTALNAERIVGAADDIRWISGQRTLRTKMLRAFGLGDGS